jgi:3-deoxy-D-manno-octulosonate 8-phosphate phosphatase (KDO 8-P phosphatase)
MTLTAQDRARRIKIVLFDVDGVLTDGGIWIPSQCPWRPMAHRPQRWWSSRVTARTMARALRWRGWAGMKCGVITKRISETVALRARDLKIEFVYQGQAFKMRPVREIMEREGVTLDEIAYVGDDVIDLPVMRSAASQLRWPMRASR